MSSCTYNEIEKYETARQGSKALERGQAPALERQEFGKLCETDNRAEGIAAFLEKRAPSAIGR